jgi:hypothetical protein
MQYVEPKNNYLACLFSKYTFKYLIYNSACNFFYARAS